MNNLRDITRDEFSSSNKQNNLVIRMHQIDDVNAASEIRHLFGYEMSSLSVMYAGTCIIQRLQRFFRHAAVNSVKRLEMKC